MSLHVAMGLFAVPPPLPRGGVYSPEEPWCGRFMFFLLCHEDLFPRLGLSFSLGTRMVRQGAELQQLPSATDCNMKEEKMLVVMVPRFGGLLLQQG